MNDYMIRKWPTLEDMTNDAVRLDQLITHANAITNVARDSGWQKASDELLYLLEEIIGEMAKKQEVLELLTCNFHGAAQAAYAAVTKPAPAPTPKTPTATKKKARKAVQS